MTSAAPAAATELAPFDTSVRCDRCGAQALVVVTLIAGDLALCGHDYRTRQTAVDAAALSVDDRRPTGW